MSTELRFDGKVALVTGGGAGIGRAYCRLLAERGAKVVVNGNVRESGAGPEAEVVAEIRAAGGEAIGVNGSISDDGAARRMIEEAVDTFGRLDILINNAGAGGKSPLIYEAPNADTERLIENHLYGPLRMSRAAFPHLAKSGAGRIINTGSSSALGWESPSGWRTCYIAAKSALFGITRQMAGAGAEHGIKVNMIMPWAFSSMVDRTIGNLPFGKWMREKLPPERVSPVVAFLAHESCPVTGQFISAAGGRVTRIVYASSHGYFNPDLTVEDVRDNWATITGEADDAGGLAGYFELEGQSSEFKEILKLVGK